MNSHMTYEKHQRSEVANYRNGHTSKKVKSHFGELDIKTPRDREGKFAPKLLPMNSRYISELEDKVISMYARVMSVRDITEMITEIYGVSLSASQISNITDKIKPLI